MLDHYEIQTKVDGKWATMGIIKGDEAAARKAWDYLRGTLHEAARLIAFDYKGRVRVIARTAARRGWRVVYGETAPVWSRVLPTKDAAEKFATKHRGFGDIVFSIEAVA